MSNKKPLANRVPFHEALMLSVMGTPEEQKQANKMLRQMNKRGTNRRTKAGR